MISGLVIYLGMAWSLKPQKGGPYSSFLIVHHCSKLIVCLDITISRHEILDRINKQSLQVTCTNPVPQDNDGNLLVARKTHYIAESIIVFHVILHSLDATWKFLRINYS